MHGDGALIDGSFTFSIREEPGFNDAVVGEAEEEAEEGDKEKLEGPFSGGYDWVIGEGLFKAMCTVELYSSVRVNLMKERFRMAWSKFKNHIASTDLFMHTHGN